MRPEEDFASAAANAIVASDRPKAAMQDRRRQGVSFSAAGNPLTPMKQAGAQNWAAFEYRDPAIRRKVGTTRGCTA